MKKVVVVTGAAMLLALMSIEEASARYRGGGFGGGFRGAGFGGGGFRGVGVGGGFRGGVVSGYRGAAFRTGAIGGYGYRGARVALGGPRYVGALRGARYVGGYGVGRRVAWAGRGYYPYRYGYRRLAWPLAAGIGLAAASSYYYNSCWRYDGWQWVNVCYAPYGYGYEYY